MIFIIDNLFFCFYFLLYKLLSKNIKTKILEPTDEKNIIITEELHTDS